jgi:hypothetical protein
VKASTEFRYGTGDGSNDIQARNGDGSNNVQGRVLVMAATTFR